MSNYKSIRQRPTWRLLSGHSLPVLISLLLCSLAGMSQEKGGQDPEPRPDRTSQNLGRELFDHVQYVAVTAGNCVLALALPESEINAQLAQ